MNVITNSITKHKTNTFQGLWLPQAARYSKKEGAKNIAKILSQPQEDIIVLANSINNKRFAFLYTLATRYNLTLFTKTASEIENSSLVNRIFNTVTKPTKEHFYFLDNFKGTFSDIFEIFFVANQNKKAMKFANKVNMDIIKQHKNIYPNLILELISSKNNNEYINNYKHYKSYLRLNRHRDDVVKRLDNMVESGTYNYKYYDNLIKTLELKYIESSMV